ncbi:aminotransferase class III-fold pyridoxal phosphate-dependent enzyme [Leptobacterium flavescens]|uniref:Aminotransferase class III-fold pyridoxal phosphate-dependent enzyme n=1 Tax=Leptobacterium flavescens TaxID=472055 RepID=A0A6P0UHP0_9FLAO|nr:aminotransferase class III-fold pyridoxal phosphate-dependent enzyme [Leptobacterium flavescens]NER12795.1 aminotransferase class III-fold pyridoxal phosphate-dependent enzyme [Leptobacterium flavescens]
MNTYSDLKITSEDAREIAFGLFNIQGDASPLPGEVDFNFRIRPEKGNGYILKISRPGEDENYLDFQQKLLQYAGKHGKDLIVPEVIPDKNGRVVSEITDEQGNSRKVRMLSWINGRIWNSVNPQLDPLRFSLGEQCGRLSLSLKGFEHEQAYRKFEWDVAQSLWTRDYLHLFEGEQKEIISFFQQRFETLQPSYDKLRRSVVHNDANDYNVIVSEDLIDPKVIAAIDYGDAIHTQLINDLAIACAYAIMDHQDPLQAALPLVEGYHSSFPLTEEDLAHLYSAISMRLTITVTKAAINKQKEPDNEYHVISERPAWEVLKKWRKINEDFATYSFRKSCGYDPHPLGTAFENWASANTFLLSDLFPTLNKKEALNADMGMESTLLSHKALFEDIDSKSFRLDQFQRRNEHAIIAGGYLEARPFYTTDAYKIETNSGYEYRTIHLGTDFWVPAQTPVHAIMDGEVFSIHNNNQHKDYGPTLILKHDFKGITFYSLYGHLSLESLTTVKQGQKVRKGDLIAFIGPPEENVGWVPHLHFQLMLDLLGNTVDFPGVCTPREKEVWAAVCPDANLLFKLEGLSPEKEVPNEELIDYRKKHLGKSLSLQYKVPIKMVRGDGQYLIDQFGRKYLDTVNNVAHVGHEHPDVVKAGQEQMALINTNSRYLHNNINELARELLETLPPELSVLHFVNSGSEANELAIRMVKANTGARDIIASEVGYHGNTNMCIDISSYKFDGKGGNGAPEHTHIFPLPDAFRGKYRGKDSGVKYAEEVRQQIKKVEEKGRKVAALILEPIISCGGQIELPSGFLKQAYTYIREAGGLCISDEVQVGCGRVGKAWWGFQLHDVVPDIVTIGKPLGNGHPLAAVACTREVADRFANGMEYFNTFGGNPVSCAIGKEVIQIVKREKLKENAFEIGCYLKEELIKLAKKFPIIGNIRGEGLFLGIELVDEKLHPLAAQTDYLANRMKDHGILMSTDGPDNNVLKIKPPLVFNRENAQELIIRLSKILEEDFMKS